MEIALPLVALSGLYLINNQSKKQNSINSYEAFSNKNQLPNTDIPNKNYPEEYPIKSSEMDQTSNLSVNNKFDSQGVYTDKYFDPYLNPAINKPKTTDSTTSKYYSLTGEQVDSTYFQHNNMVPFFGSSIRTQHANANSNESVLDNLNGTGSQIFSKKEQSPLFSPHENLQWAYGAPNTNDFYQSRVNPSSRMANVKPFVEQRVAPGLGLGYTTEGAGGFNSGMAMRDSWRDKTVDELRVDNKPKSSGHMLIGHEGPANSYIKFNSTTDHMGIMERHLPDKDFEFTQDRWFTTTGVGKGQTLHSIPIEKNQARSETTRSYAGVAAYQNGAPNNGVSGASTTYVTGEYMPSKNIQLGEVPLGVANANGRNYATDADYEIRAKTAYPNNRSQNPQNDYYGIMGGAVGAVVAPLLDVLRPSRKENTIGTLRPYQNPKSNVAQSYIFNPDDRLPTTIRETTENSKFHLNVNANQLGGAYIVTEQQPTNTTRQTTGNFFYAGNAGAGEGTKGFRPYDNAYNQRNNDIKSSTIDGYMVQGNMKLMNSNINMKTTPKDNYLKNSRDVVPTMPYQSPDIGNMGRLQGTNELYSNIQLDRNESSILDSLKGNPYALSVTNAFGK
jgi:hypothetical protein